jgi:hypothetical protein
VLLHGAGANTVMWMGDAADWSTARRVYAVDVIGEPGLSAPSRPPLASGAYADWPAPSGSPCWPPAGSDGRSTARSLPRWC